MSELVPHPQGYPIKLVRDRTTAIIGDRGTLFYDHIPVEARGPWLRRKLIEEASEYVIDPDVPELADVLAVIEGLASVHGLTLQGLIEHMDEDPRGGFLTGRMMRGHHAAFDGN